MRKYYSFFRLRFIFGLQYRAAALGGIVTQFFWGALSILMFRTFYITDPKAFPMELSSLTTYIWLQQAFLSLYMVWAMENEIFYDIQSGNIAYEICRPISIYSMWFARSLANRISRAVLRCMPILIFAAVLPYPYGIGLPVNGAAAIWFVISMLLSLFVVVAFCMLIYLSAFYTISSQGIRIVAATLSEFLSGGVIPLPFLPDGIRQVVELLPFASMENVPLRVYSGNLAGSEMYYAVGLQAFWLIALVCIGNLLCTKAMKRIVVQGG